MKYNVRNYRQFLQKPASTIRGLLLFGPDEGMVEERFREISGVVTKTPDDPFAVTDLSAARLSEDPKLLLDSAAGMSFGGGTKVVRVRNADKAPWTPFRDYLEAAPEDAFCLATSGPLKPGAKLRKIFENAKNAAALGCYEDDSRSLKALVQEGLSKNGLHIEADALTLLVSNLGADRMASRQEVEKLVTYAGNTSEISVEDVEAVIGDASSRSLPDLAFALGERQPKRALDLFDKLRAEDISPVAILRTVGWHFLRLQKVRGAVDRGTSASNAINQLRPPVIFKQKNSFERQVKAWPAPALISALSRLHGAEKDCKTTGLPAEAVCCRCLLHIARPEKQRL